MAEIRGNAAGGPKAKASQGRDDSGKGKGAGVGVVSSPTSGKKRSEGLGGKGQLQLPHAKPKIVASVSKSVKVKGKASVSSSKTITRTKKKSTTIRVKANKVYTLPGQKYDPPEEREPLRIFYESLSKQIPSSEMAEFWMMEHGLLSPEKAKKANVRKQKRQQQLRMGTPIKSSKPQRPESSKKQPVLKNGDIKARKRVNYNDDDNDVIVKLKKAKN